MMKSRFAALGLCVAVFLIVTSSARGQVAVVRGGEENPVATIAKSTLYGGAAGLLLGLAAALVVEENEGDIIKWSFVGGTFGGFLFGVYHVATRPRPRSALLQIEPGGPPKWSLPNPEVRLTRDGSVAVRANLISASF